MTDETPEVPAAPPEIPDGARLIARITGAADGPPWLLLRLGDGGLALQAHGGDGSVRALDLHARRALFRAICDEDGPDLIGGAVEQPREALRNVTAFLRTWRAAHPGADTIAVEDGPCPPLWASDVTTLVMALALGAGHLGGGLPDEDIAAFLDERLGLPGGRKVYADADDGEIILTAGEHGAARPALWVATAPDDWTGHLLDESDVQALLGGFARAYADIETRFGVAGWSLGFDLDRGDGSQAVITLRPDSGRLAPQIAASRAAGCRHLVPCLPGRCSGRYTTPSQAITDAVDASARTAPGSPPKDGVVLLSTAEGKPAVLLHPDEGRIEITPDVASGELLRRALLNALEALRLTREYVGEETLPALPGWSWYDATRAGQAVLAATVCQYETDTDRAGCPLHGTPMPPGGTPGSTT